MHSHISNILQLMYQHVRRKSLVMFEKAICAWKKKYSGMLKVKYIIECVGSIED